MQAGMDMAFAACLATCGKDLQHSYGRRHVRKTVLHNSALWSSSCYAHAHLQASAHFMKTIAGGLLYKQARLQQCQGKCSRLGPGR